MLSYHNCNDVKVVERVHVISFGTTRLCLASKIV